MIDFDTPIRAKNSDVEGVFYEVESGHAPRAYSEVASFRHDPTTSPITIPGRGDYVMPEGTSPLKPNKGGVICAMGLSLVRAAESGGDTKDGTADVYIRKASTASRILARLLGYDAAPEVAWTIPSLANPNK